MTATKAKPLPPPPHSDGEYIYGRDPMTGQITGLVAVKGAVTVPIDRWAEYRAHYNLVVKEVVQLPGSGTLIVVERVEHA